MKEEAIKGPVRKMIFRNFGAKGLRRGLRHGLAGPSLSMTSTQVREETRAIDWKAGELMVSDAMRTIDPPSRGHLEWGAWMLAAWQVLRPRLDCDQAAVEFLGDASMHGFDTRVSRMGLALLLRSCRFKPDQAIVILTALLEQSGASCESELAQDGSGLILHITKCFYSDFFSSHQTPQLTTATDRLYEFWFNGLAPKRHGFRFDRDRYAAMNADSDSHAFPILIERS